MIFTTLANSFLIRERKLGTDKLFVEVKREMNPKKYLRFCKVSSAKARPS
jgi:hypothetical protein